MDLIAAQLDKTSRAHFEILHDGRAVITQTTFDGEQRTWISAQLDRKFPPYRRVIPSAADAAATATLEIQPAIEALDTLAIMATQKDQNPIIYLQTTDAGTVELKTDAGEKGQATETLPAETTGDQMKIAINPHYLADALKARKDAKDFIIYWQSDVSPLMLRATTDDQWIHWTYIMMPIRIS